MKEPQKIAITFLIIIVIFFTALHKANQHMTPRLTGEIVFPLDQKWTLCVDEKIRDVSTNRNGVVLVKTNTALNAYNESTGSLIWKSLINSQRETFPPIVTDDKVFVSDSDNLWAFELLTGKTLWKTPLDSTDTWVPYASNSLVLLNSLSSSIEVYDTVSGRKLWETEGDRGYTKAYIEQNKVYIIDNGIKVFEAATGNLIETIDDNSITDLSTFSNGVIYYTKYHGVGIYDGDGTYDLIAYNVKTKDELWKINFDDNDSTFEHPINLYIHNNFLFMTKLGFVYRIDPENGEIKWKKEFSNPQNLSIIDNNLYFLTPFEGIIHSLDIETGQDTGSLQISSQKIVNTQSQRVISTKANLVIARDCDIFIFGKQ